MIAGKSHPADDGGKQLIAQMVKFADDPALRHRIAFLPDYDIAMARYLYWGVDVWLNNPLRPLEACGTSGMKAALNGALNLSILDGWWDEWFDGENGWAIPSADVVADADRRDDLEANALYDLIGQPGRAAVLRPRPERASRTRWVQMVRHTLVELGPEGDGDPDGARLRRAASTRPAAAAGRPPRGGRLRRGARRSPQWRNGVVDAWPGVKVVHVESHVDGDPQLGGHAAPAGRGRPQRPRPRRRRRVGGLRRRSTRTIGSSTSARCRCRRSRSSDGPSRYDGDMPLERTGSFGYTVRVLPKSELLSTFGELGLIASA